MGRLSTLLGLNPRPRSALPAVSGPAYQPTPGGGMQPIMQVGQPQFQIPERNMGGNPFGIPPNAGNVNLQRILALRAANGDTEAGRILGSMRA